MAPEGMVHCPEYDCMGAWVTQNQGSGNPQELHCELQKLILVSSCQYERSKQLARESFIQLPALQPQCVIDLPLTGLLCGDAICHQRATQLDCCGTNCR